MHKTASEAAGFVHQLASLIPHPPNVEIVLAPPYTALQAVSEAIRKSPHFLLGAQNLFWEDQGPYTGEISAPMLKDLGCRYVIVGHSERRQIFGERDEDINKKIRAALRHRLQPILCVGESLSERKQERTAAVIADQLRKALEGVPQEEISSVTIAYEPIWAIGTGQAASIVQAATAHQVLREVLAQGWGMQATQAVRILYGGSVTPENAQGFLSSASVDGALIGGACLNPNSFATIIDLARESSHRGD